MCQFGKNVPAAIHLRVPRVRVIPAKFSMCRLVIVALAAALCVARAAPAEPSSSTSPVPILRQAADGPNPDGSYAYSFETGDGVKAEEQGKLKDVGSETEALTAQGAYSFTAPDGTAYQVSYVADENGFQPQGAHLPVAPPVPEAIVRALEWIAAHPQKEETEKPIQTAN